MSDPSDAELLISIIKENQLISSVVYFPTELHEGT